MAGDQTRYGYTVRANDEDDYPVITMRTRHDAVGLAAVLNRGTDATYDVEAKEVHHEGELATLTAPAGSDKGVTA